jgi:hypothetical protein
MPVFWMIPETTVRAHIGKLHELAAEALVASAEKTPLDASRLSAQLATMADQISSAVKTTIGGRDER